MQLDKNIIFNKHICLGFFTFELLEWGQLGFTENCDVALKVKKSMILTNHILSGKYFVFLYFFFLVEMCTKKWR